MRKTVLLPGLCLLLLCISVRGTQERVFDRDFTERDYYDDIEGYDHNDLQLPWYYYRDEFPDPDEEKMLKMEVLTTLVEDVQEAARAIASEMASDPKRRIKFGKLLGHFIKPIKSPSWWHKPHQTQQAPSTDFSVDIGAEIVVPPPSESSEHEE